MLQQGSHHVDNCFKWRGKKNRIGWVKMWNRRFVQSPPKFLFECPAHIFVTARQLHPLTLVFWMQAEKWSHNLTSENITCSAASRALLTNSFWLCHKHESSSSGPTPWKPFNTVLQCFYHWELSLSPQWANHQRHSLYYWPLKSFWISMRHEDGAISAW